MLLGHQNYYLAAVGGTGWHGWVSIAQVWTWMQGASQQRPPPATHDYNDSIFSFLMYVCFLDTVLCCNWTGVKGKGTTLLWKKRRLVFCLLCFCWIFKVQWGKKKKKSSWRHYFNKAGPQRKKTLGCHSSPSETKVKWMLKLVIIDGKNCQSFHIAWNCCMTQTFQVKFWLVCFCSINLTAPL